MPVKNDRDYGIVIGINKYRKLRPELRGAERDAERFRDWLVAEHGGNLPDDDDHILTCPNDDDGFGPRLVDLEDLFIEFSNRSDGFEEVVGRRLYVFMAGHGVSEGIDDGILLASDHSASIDGRLAATIYADIMAEAGIFEELVVFVDCCRDTVLELGRPRTRFLRKPDAMAAIATNRLYGFATGQGLKAREKTLNGQCGGIFTEALLRALKGEGSQDGVVTSQSLARSTKELVIQLRDKDSPQESRFPIREDITLVVLPPEVQEEGLATIRVVLSRPDREFELYSGTDIRTPLDRPRTQVGDLEWEIKVTPFKLYKVVDRDDPNHYKLLQVNDEVARVEL